MSAVLADTGPLYALLDIDDQYHEEARQQLARLTVLNLNVIVLQPIILESYTLILRKLGPAAARLWLRELTRGVRILNPTADDYEDARKRVAAYPYQQITLFDSILATLANRLAIPVWTYDFHFDVMRIDSWRGL